MMKLSSLSTKDLQDELERRKSDVKQNNYDKFLSCYSGKELLKKCGLQDAGLWLVYGEDPNCDFGGCHSQPFLGLYQGKLDDVIRAVVVVGGFFTWGSGGSIQKVEAIKV